MNYLRVILLAVLMCFPLAIEAQQAEKQVKRRPEQKNAQVVREWIAAINAHDGDRLAATLNEDKHTDDKTHHVIIPLMRDGKPTSRGRSGYEVVT